MKKQPFPTYVLYQYETLQKFAKKHGYFSSEVFVMLHSSSALRQPTKILCIAPYEEMKQLMLDLAAQRKDISIDVFIGNLDGGVAILKEHLRPEHEVILSRGGTSQLLMEYTTLPVVEVGFSQYDLLKGIRLSERYPKEIALVGFPSIAQNARMLCELLQYHIDIFAVNRQKDIQPTLAKVKEHGYGLVLCGTYGAQAAQKLGLNSLLISSGADSISAAFDEAVRISHDRDELQKSKLFFMDILRGCSDTIIVMNREGTVTFSTVDEEQEKRLYTALRTNLDSYLEKEPHKVYLELDKSLYTLSCRYLSYLNQRYAVFYYTKSELPLSVGRIGIHFSNQKETEDHFFGSFFSMTNANRTIRTTLQNINLSNVPVMICGELGTGKCEVARLIYSRSLSVKRPMITINCASVTERGWNYLLNHHSSPLMKNDNTIYFQDIQELSQEHRSLLMSFIMDTNLSHRNRVIFSCRCPLGRGIPAETMQLINLLSCVTLHLPALRDHADEIPHLARLYLSTLSASDSQPYTIEPAGMELMKQFCWTNNYTQFKRFLNELAFASDDRHISTALVKELLERERFEEGDFRPRQYNAYTGSEIDLTRSLKDITHDIIDKVLEQYNGNQSAAAKQLGIGRSTLWRYLRA